jgi:hypothetical protein
MILNIINEEFSVCKVADYEENMSLQKQNNERGLSLCFARY